MTTASDRSAPGRKGGEVARIAARWCRDPGFQRWIDERSGRRRRAGSDVTLTQAEAMARVLVLVACGIGSRVELDHDEAAAARFDALIRRPYLAHLATQQVPEAKRMATALAGRMDAWQAGQ